MIPRAEYTWEDYHAGVPYVKVEEEEEPGQIGTWDMDNYQKYMRANPLPKEQLEAAESRDSGSSDPDVWGEDIWQNHPWRDSDRDLRRESLDRECMADVLSIGFWDDSRTVYRVNETTKDDLGDLALKKKETAKSVGQSADQRNIEKALEKSIEKSVEQSGDQREEYSTPVPEVQALGSTVTTPGPSPADSGYGASIGEFSRNQSVVDTSGLGRDATEEQTIPLMPTQVEVRQSHTTQVLPAPAVTESNHGVVAFEDSNPGFAGFDDFEGQETAPANLTAHRAPSNANPATHDVSRKRTHSSISRTEPEVLNPSIEKIASLSKPRTKKPYWLTRDREPQKKSKQKELGLSERVALPASTTRQTQILASTEALPASVYPRQNRTRQPNQASIPPTSLPIQTSSIPLQTSSFSNPQPNLAISNIICNPNMSDQDPHQRGLDTQQHLVAITMATVLNHPILSYGKIVEVSTILQPLLQQHISFRSEPRTLARDQLTNLIAQVKNDRAFATDAIQFFLDYIQVQIRGASAGNPGVPIQNDLPTDIGALHALIHTERSCNAYLRSLLDEDKSITDGTNHNDHIHQLNELVESLKRENQDAQAAFKDRTSQMREAFLKHSNIKESEISVLRANLSAKESEISTLKSRLELENICNQIESPQSKSPPSNEQQFKVATPFTYSSPLNDASLSSPLSAMPPQSSNYDTSQMSGPAAMSINIDHGVPDHPQWQCQVPTESGVCHQLNYQWARVKEKWVSRKHCVACGGPNNGNVLWSKGGPMKSAPRKNSRPKTTTPSRTREAAAANVSQADAHFDSFLNSGMSGNGAPSFDYNGPMAPRSLSMSNIHGNNFQTAGNVPAGNFAAGGQQSQFFQNSQAPQTPDRTNGPMAPQSYLTSGSNGNNFQYNGNFAVGGQPSQLAPTSQVPQTPERNNAGAIKQSTPVSAPNSQTPQTPKRNSVSTSTSANKRQKQRQSEVYNGQQQRTASVGSLTFPTAINNLSAQPPVQNYDMNAYHAQFSPPSFDFATQASLNQAQDFGKPMATSITNQGYAQSYLSFPPSGMGNSGPSYTPESSLSAPLTPTRPEGINTRGLNYTSGSSLSGSSTHTSFNDSQAVGQSYTPDLPASAPIVSSSAPISSSTQHMDDLFGDDQDAPIEIDDDDGLDNDKLLNKYFPKGSYDPTPIIPTEEQMSDPAFWAPEVILPTARSAPAHNNSTFEVGSIPATATPTDSYNVRSAQPKHQAPVRNISGQEARCAAAGVLTLPTPGPEFTQHNSSPVQSSEVSHVATPMSATPKTLPPGNPGFFRLDVEGKVVAKGSEKSTDAIYDLETEHLYTEDEWETYVLFRDEIVNAKS